MKRRIWKIKEFTPQAGLLGKKYNLSPYLAQILLNRNIEEKDFNSFLTNTSDSLNSPFLLPDIKKAVKRIRKAVETKEKIMVVGDYDVDGVTSLAIFNEFIKEHKELFAFYIPHRVNEGYGLNAEVIERQKTKNGH
jgi:single-stranded-DNA-specific exonuclease